MPKMLAAYLPGNSTVDLREIERPRPGIGQVLLKMKASGICGSDTHYIYHKHLGDDPRTSYRAWWPDMSRRARWWSSVRGTAISSRATA